MKVKINVRQLTDECYARISNLKEIMEKEARGYGIVEIEFDGYVFAIPFRSNMNHNHGFKTLFCNQTKTWKGLDYSKCVLVERHEIIPESFELDDSSEFARVQRNADKIFKQFIDYVNRYCRQVRKGKPCLPGHFGYTTLVNYHKELGLE